MISTNKYICEFCQKSFRKESTLSVHLCEPKRRRQERNNRAVDLGFKSYLKFYEITQGSAKLKTFEHFADSPYYRAFVKFGRYCIETRVINTSHYVEWLLKNNRKLDRWTSDQIYTEYLIYYLQHENAIDALTRAIEWSLDWSDKNQAPAQDCLRYGNNNVLCHAITNGRLSAWVIYNCEGGRKFLNSIDSQQLSTIWPYIDADIWQRKFQDYAADTSYVQEMLGKGGW
jgi:hypothetical protein